MNQRQLPEQAGFALAVREGNKGHTVAWFAEEGDAKVFGEALLRDNPDIEAVSLVRVNVTMRFSTENSGMVSAVTLKQSGLTDQAGGEPS